MKYLLDVNVLLAGILSTHSHNEIAEKFLEKLPAKAEVLLCPWVEIGAIRVGVQAGYIEDIETAKKLVAGFCPGKANLVRIADDSHAGELPVWVKTPRQIGDGHLLALAKKHNAKLLTLDGGIPGAETL